MGLVSEAAVVADFGEGTGGADDEVAGFLDAKVAEVGLGGHAEAGFKFAEEGGKGEVGGLSEVGDGDIVAVILVEKLESPAEFLVHAEGGGSLAEGAGDTDDAADFSVLVIEGLFGGVGPVDEAVAAGGEFDAVDDGLPGFEDGEVILANVFENVGRDVVVVAFSENGIGGGFEDFAEALIVGDVTEVAIFDEVDEAGEVIKDGGKVVLDLVLLKESVILHGLI